MSKPDNSTLRWRWCFRIALSSVVVLFAVYANVEPTHVTEDGRKWAVGLAAVVIGYWLR